MKFSAGPGVSGANKGSRCGLPTSGCGSSLLFDISCIGDPAALQRGTAPNLNQLRATALAAESCHDVRQHDQHNYHRAQF